MLPSTSINNIIREQKKKDEAIFRQLLDIFYQDSENHRLWTCIKNCLVKLTGNKEVMFHSVSRKFAKREKKPIHKALFTRVVIVNVNKLSGFLKKHYFVQSFLTIESCNTIFLSRTNNLISGLENNKM